MVMLLDSVQQETNKGDAWDIYGSSRPLLSIPMETEIIQISTFFIPHLLHGSTFKKICKQYIRVAGYQKGHQVKIWILSNNIIFIIMGLWIFKGQLKVMLFILHMTFNFYSVSCIFYLWSLISCFCCFLKSTSDVKQILTKGRCRNKSMGVWSQDSVWMRGIISVLPATEWIYRAGILSYYACFVLL